MLYVSMQTMFTAYLSRINVHKRADKKKQKEGLAEVHAHVFHTIKLGNIQNKRSNTLHNT